MNYETTICSIPWTQKTSHPLDDIRRMIMILRLRCNTYHRQNRVTSDSIVRHTILLRERHLTMIRKAVQEYMYNGKIIDETFTNIEASDFIFNMFGVNVITVADDDDDAVYVECLETDYGVKGMVL